MVVMNTHLLVYFTSGNGEDDGVEKTEEKGVKRYQWNGQIVVEGAESNMATLYGAVGRVLATKRDNYSLLRFDVPAVGTYLIRIGNTPARRVVVVW